MLPKPCTSCPGTWTTLGNASTSLKDCRVSVTDAYIKDALLRGVKELGADPSERTFDDWLPQADLCTGAVPYFKMWRGVDCDGHTNSSQGIAITLSFDIPLKGRLPSAWGALGHHLVSVSMEFGYSALQRNYPKCTGAVSNASCQLVSPYVPETWTNFTNMRNMRLSNLGLQGAVPLHIFAKMPRLQMLDLAYNQFTTLPAPLVGQFKGLRQLVVCNNTLGAHLPDLQDGTFPHLQDLDLSNNMMTGSVPLSFGAALKDLRFLALDHNMLDTLIIEPDSFPGLSYLQMAHNRLSGKMPNVMRLKRLNRVYLSYNSLTSLPDVWWHNMPADKPRPWYRNQDFLMVVASHNKILGSLPPLASTEGANGTFRLSVDLSFNELSGSIKASVRKAGTSRHGYLIAVHNNLSGTLPPNLMHWFSGVVDLSHNMLSGSCPERWHCWESLHGLYLEHNNLQGPLPAIYSNWSRLVALDLGSNPLNTTIPPTFLGTYPFKEFGDGREYEMHGAIRQVYLNNCSLHGTLPSSWLSHLLIEGHALAIHDNPDLEGCLPQATSNNAANQESCDMNLQISQVYCSTLSLLRRRPLCYSCFKEGQLDRLTDAFSYGDILLRFDCSQADEPLYINGMALQHDTQLCDSWSAWPNSTCTCSAGEACSGVRCAALANTRVSGVCQL